MIVIKKFNLKIWLVSMAFVSLIGAGGLSLTSSLTTNAAGVSGNPSCAPSFLTFPVWYRGLTVSDTDCSIKSPGTGSTDLSNYIWTIVLNIIDIGLQIVGYITAFFILYGGFLFLTSSGESANIAKARTTILNAIIGLVISIVSIAIVNLIFGIIK